MDKEIGVVVSTIGRRSLATLISSVPDEYPVRVAWQSSDPMPDEHSFAGRDIEFVLSRGGVSAGRNDAIRTVTSVSWLLFPNDDTIYPVDFFRELRSWLDTLPPRHIGVFGLTDVDGRERLGIRRWSQPTTEALRVLQCAHEPRLVVPLSLVLDVGVFNADIGVGSSGDLQSGEGSDLVARAIRAGYSVVDAPPHLHALEERQEVGIRLAEKRSRYLPGAAWVLGAHPWLPGRRRALLRLVVGGVRRSGDLSIVWRGLRAYRKGLRDANSTRS